MNEAIKRGISRYMLYKLKDKGIIEQTSNKESEIIKQVRDILAVALWPLCSTVIREYKRVTSNFCRGSINA